MFCCGNTACYSSPHGHAVYINISALKAVYSSIALMTQIQVSADLATTIHLSLKPHTRPAPDVNCSNPFGTIDLVSTDRHQVDVVLIDIDGDFANGLGCICVEEDLSFSAHLAYLLCGLDDTCTGS